MLGLTPPTLDTDRLLIPRDFVDEIIVVDDRRRRTVEIAQELGVRLIWHPHNVGYGGNQKTCYLEALQRGADVVVMVIRTGSTSRP